MKKMTDYRVSELEDMANYLSYCVKEGCISEEDAEEMIENQEWELIERLRDIGEAYANDNERGEETQGAL